MEQCSRPSHPATVDEPDLPGPTEYDRLTKAEKEYWAGVQRLRPTVWAFQRNAHRAGAIAAMQFALGTLVGLLLLTLLFRHVVRPLLAIAWRLLMRAVNDLSRAIRGKYDAAA